MPVAPSIDAYFEGGADGELRFSLSSPEHGGQINLVGWSAHAHVQPVAGGEPFEIATVIENGIVTIPIPAALTADLPRGTTRWRFELDLVNPEGVQTRLVKGRMIFVRTVAVG